MSLPRPRTIRARLTLTTTVVMALVLLALGFLVDVGTRRTLMASVDAELARRGEGFAEGRGRRPGPRPGEPPRLDPFGILGMGPPDGGRGGGPFRRGNASRDQGRPRFIQPAPRPGEGPTGPSDAPYDAATATALQTKGGGPRHTTVLVKGEPTRIYSVATREGERVTGVVQVAYPLGEIENSLDGLRRFLLTVVVPLGTLLTALASLFIVGRMLRPLRIITENAQTIGAGNLEDRLPVVGQDEFAGLATTLNGMLERLEGAFRLEQATTRRLAETVDQQRRFTADASHELKTPLATIKAHVGLLAGVGNEDDQESVVEINAAANRMRGLIDDLLTLARADGGSLTARTAPVDLGEAVSAAVGAVSPLRVEVRGAPRPLVIEGNGDALTRLFINLLDNAKKYAGTDEPVEVHLAKKGSTAEIAVIDRGVGIAPEHLPRIFDRFYRPDVSRTSETGGTGLGLAICREIAAAHGGTLEVASRPGAGTTFTVALPLAS